jgi:hypothetical protein
MYLYEIHVKSLPVKVTITESDSTVSSIQTATTVDSRAEWQAKFCSRFFFRERAVTGDKL